MCFVRKEMSLRRGCTETCNVKIMYVLPTSAKARAIGSDGDTEIEREG